MLALFKISKFLFRHVIPRRWRYACARGLAYLLIRLDSRRRAILIQNLTPLVGVKESRRLAPRQLGNFLMTAVDFFCAAPGLARRTETVNWHLLEQAYRKT